MAQTSATFCGKIKKSVKWQIEDDQPSISVLQVQVSGMSLTKIRIIDLCSALVSQSMLGKDLGFLEADDMEWRCSVKYKKTHNYDDAESLAQLLQRNAETGSASRIIFSWRDRLAAAATLAYSVLFLDGSWLKPVWNSSDILLIKEADTVIDQHGTQHIVNELAFSWVTCTPATVDAESEKKCERLKMQRKTAVLFALALALIELSLGEPMERMKTDEEKLDDFVGGNTAAATRLLPSCKKRVVEYHEAVRRCLDCPFDIRNPSMDNETFLGVYFDEIARPLMSNYEQFIGSK